ncbi:MAG: AsmA family protein, partial [Emcibacteraceae bacterium]|nr:AsmA family protein [Emcibacteraceae bacterium]
MKKIGIGAGILLILLIGSALVVPSFIDWNKYKAEIESTASNLSERKVTINGDLSLSILPSPSFSAKDVSVSNVEGGKATHFVTLKSVDVNVAFFPLLSSDVQVKKFILVEPIIALEVDENGKGNWEFGSAADQNQSNSATEMSFEQFQVENGQISYQDLTDGTQELLRGISANVTMDSLNGPFEIDGDVRYKNLPVNVDITVGTVREGRKIPLNI